MAKKISPVSIVVGASRSDLRQACWRALIVQPKASNAEIAAKVRTSVGSQVLPLKYARQLRLLLKAMPEGQVKAWLKA